MLTINTSGDQTAVVGTEHTLASVAAPGIFVLQVDTGNMILGDLLEVRVRVRHTDGGNYKQLSYNIYAHVQEDVIKQSVPIVAPYGAEFSIKQTGGTARVFPWLLATL